MTEDELTQQAGDAEALFDALPTTKSEHMALKGWTNGGTDRFTLALVYLRRTLGFPVTCSNDHVYDVALDPDELSVYGQKQHRGVRTRLKTYRMMVDGMVANEKLSRSQRRLARHLSVDVNRVIEDIDAFLIEEELDEVDA